MAKISMKPHRHFEPKHIVMSDEMAKKASDMERSVIGEIVQKRFDMDVSAVELGEAAGMNYTTIGKYENFKVSPTLYTLCTVAAVLGLKIKVVREED